MRTSTVAGDLRYAFRALRRTPSLVAVVVLCLGIGIGANATVFSWMEQMVLRPVPGMRDPGALVLVNTISRGDVQSLSYPAYVDVRDAARTLAGVGAFSMKRFGLQDPRQAGAAAEPVWGAYATGNYFDVLGIRPLLGRMLQPDDARASGGAPVAVIGYALWRRRFAADPHVVGRAVQLNGRQLTIVGVAPPDFTGTYSGLSFDVWVPVTMLPLLDDSPDQLDRRGIRWLEVIGRRAAGASLPQTNAEIAAIGRRLAATYPEDRDRTLAAATWNAGPAQRFMRPLLGILLGVTGLVLLVVCANVASLLLARGMARQRELGVRVALGANRWQLIRQLLTEGVLLAAGGGAVGLVVAAWGKSLLDAAMPATILPIRIEPRLDLRVLAFAAVVALGACILVTLLPAFRATRVDLTSSLKNGSAAAGQSQSRARGVLVVAQIAFALTAIVCAGLFLRSLSALRRVDPGFRDAAHVLLYPTDLSLAGAGDRAARDRLTTQVLERVRALPGVRSAAFSSRVPLGFDAWSTFEVHVPGYQPRPNEPMAMMVAQVSPDYFATMSIPVLDGRAIDDRDRAGAPTAVVVNETFARRYFAGREAVGQHIEAGRDLVIVGVARDGKYRFDQLDRPSPPYMYFSQAQWGNPQLTLHVRTVGDPTVLASAIRRELASAAPALPVMSPMTLEEYTSAALIPERLGAIVLSALGALALFLSAIGLYGRLAFAVTQRTRDIGIRLAIGASPARVMRVVLEDAGRIAAVGAAVGALMATGAGRVLGSLLAAVPAMDAGVLATAALLLAAITLAASWLPARRASRIDPLAALKCE